ncbi:LiaF transmembrane domain-containing protein [Chitinophaga parva]|nr:DUF5668 domain-containing protein [Chitinophaga parva]
MEKQDIPASAPTPTPAPRGRNRNFAGLMLIAVGTFFLLDKLDLGLPEWLFQWPSLLILIGIVIAIRNDFRGGNWIALIVVGSVFLVREADPHFFNIRQELIWPIMLILVGLFIYLRHTFWPDRYDCARDDWKRRVKREARNTWEQAYYNSKMPPPPPLPNMGMGPAHAFAKQQSTTDDDFIYASAVFSGTQKTVLSKNFQGGNLTAMFGGLEVNLMQADINGTAVLHVNTFCGGTEIIVPGNWTVRLEETTMFGGSEDSRPASLLSPDPNKVLVIRGSCVFGGLEVKSY